MTSELVVEELTVRFGGVTALSDVKFAAEAGTTLGIIGPNGAGKTTLLNAVCGLVRPSKGRVRFRDTVLTGLRSEQVAALGVARTFQLAEGFSDFTVWDYVCLGLAPAGAVSSRRDREVAVAIALEAVGLSAYGSAPLRSLPYGTRKLVDLCRATVGQPHLLLLDEPTSGLSREERREMLDHLANLKTRIRTLVLVDHDVGFISQVSERLVAIAYGRVLTEGPPRQVLENADVIAAYMG